MFAGVAIPVTGSVIDFDGSTSPDTGCLCCLCDFCGDFAVFVDKYCGDFGFLVGLVVQGKEIDDISPGQLVAKRTQLQVDVKNGVSLAVPSIELLIIGNSGRRPEIQRTSLPETIFCPRFGVLVYI